MINNSWHVFLNKCSQVIRSVLTGVLDVRPTKILATDKDSINAPIHYAFVNGTPSSYLSYFLIDGQTGNKSICGYVFLNWIAETLPEKNDWILPCVIISVHFLSHIIMQYLLISNISTPCSIVTFIGIIRQIRPIDNDQETRFEIYLKV